MLKKTNKISNLSIKNKTCLNYPKKMSLFVQDDTQTSQRQTPVNPAQGLFGLRVATPPFGLLGLGGSQRGTALREELAPVIRELGPEMRDFGLQVREEAG